MNKLEKIAANAIVEALVAKARGARQAIERGATDLFTKPQFTVPESLIFTAGGATLPVHGFAPALAGSLGGIGALRLYNRSKLMRSALKNPLLALVGGSIGGFIAGKKLT